MFFSTVEVLFGHRDIAFEGIVDRADGFIQQGRVADTVEYFFSSFEIALFQIFLDEAEGTYEEVGEDGEGGDDIEGQGFPETPSQVGGYTQGQADDADEETVFDIEIVHFHRLQR